MSDQGKLDRFVNRVLNKPYVTLFITLLVTVLSLTQLVDFKTGKALLELDASVDSLLPRKDPGREYFEHVKTVFDGGGTILIALVDENDMFTSPNLETLKTLSEELENLDMVRRVSSLSLSLNIRGEGDELLIQPFYDDVPTEQAALEDLKKRALSDPIYAGNLVSKDGRIAIIVVNLLDIPEKELLDSKIDERVSALAREKWTHGEVWITGASHIKSQMSEVMIHDVTTVVPLAALLMALVALISFRSLRGVLIPVLSIGVATVVTLAFMALVFDTLNQVSIAVPSLIIVVGFSYGIHVMSCYYDALRHNTVPEGESIARYVLKDTFAPIMYTGITTAVGFYSLGTSSISAIQEFAVAAGTGVCITMLVSVTFAPAALQILARPKKVFEGSEDTALDRAFVKLAQFNIKHAKKIFAFNILVVILCLLAVPNINIGTDLVNSFKETSEVRKDFYAVNENLQGANGFDIVFETSVIEGFKEPANLKVIEALQEWLKQQPGVGGSTSIVDYIKVIHKGLSGDENSYRIPDSSQTVDQLLAVGGNPELKDFASHDYQTARVMVRLKVVNSSDVIQLGDKIDAYLKDHAPQHLRGQITGNSYLVAKTMDNIAFGQAMSILSAFIFIYLILALIFMSFKAGFIALLPNIVPVLIFFGILGWSGVALNVTTGLVACIVLGIAVDDTIHLMAQFNKFGKLAGDQNKGIELSLKHVGRPVTYTTVALCLGFLTMLMSDMQTQIEFGVLSAVTLFFGWISDVTLTPAIATRMKIVTLFDVMALNLGPNPTQSIPLFSGLSDTQARIATLLGSLKKYKQGDTIFKIGDKGNNMFVVIDGVLRVSLDGDNGPIHLKDIRRGDIIGEVALYHGARTANVTADTDVELLEITKSDLEIIQRRNPKIAAQLYANLNKIFANRFADVTARLPA